MKEKNSMAVSYLMRAADRGATAEELDILCEALFLVRKYHLTAEQVPVKHVSYERFVSPCAIMIDVPTFDSKEEAKKVLREMLAIAADYGDISVNDFYDLCGLSHKTQFKYNRYGWQEKVVRKLKIEPCAYGYIIDVSCADRLR